MRTETKLFLGLGIFMLPLGIIYWFTSYEHAGSLLIVVVAIAFMFIGTYLGIQSRRLGGSRPEDYDATYEEGKGTVGAFPVGSIYPLLSAVAAMLIAYGAVFTSFLVYPGVLLIFLVVIGMARESVISELHHEDVDAHNQPGVNPEPTFSDRVKK
jgi:phosphatidylglycerophosphate synthase